jgi:hypothetical protein
MRDSLSAKLCNVLVRFGAFEEAEDLIAQLLERSTSARGQGDLWSVRGSVGFYTHRLGLASMSLSKAAWHYDAAGEVGELSVALTGLASCQMLLGDLDTAEQTLLRAIPLTDAMHNKRHGSIGRATLASIFLRRMQPSKAPALLSEALRMALELKDLRQERSIQILSAGTAFILQDLEKMAEAVARLLVIAGRISPDAHGVTKALEAVCLLHQGERDRASASWGASCQHLAGSLHISDEAWAELWEMHLAAHELWEPAREGVPRAQLHEVRSRLRRWMRQHEVPRAPLKQTAFRGPLEHHLHVLMLETLVEQSGRRGGTAGSPPVPGA